MITDKKIVLSDGGSATRVELSFHFGELVYLRSDRDQIPNYITGILIRGNNIYYGASRTGEERWYFDFELSSSKVFSF